MSLLKGIVAYWKLEESASPSMDATGRANDLTWVQGASQGAGIIGYGLDCDLGGDRAYHASNDDLAPGIRDDFTICGWFKPDADWVSEAGYNTIASLPAVYRIEQHITGGNHVRFTCYHSGGSVRVEVPYNPVVPSDWFFYRAWRDGNTINLQINCGTAQSTAFDYDLRQYGLLSFYLGGGDDGGTYSYSNGTQDEVGIWNRVLENWEAERLCAGLQYPFGLCGYLAYGSYEFPNTFHPADDNLDWQIPSIKATRRHGGHSLNATLKEKRLTVRGGIIKGPMNRSIVLRDELDDLRGALGGQPQNLYFEPDRYWRNVRVEMFRNPYGPTHYCRISEAIEIVFITDDPFQYAVMESSDTWNNPTTGERRALSVGGNAPAQATFTVTPGGTGSQTIDFTIENETTGESFTLSGSVLGGEAIEIDTLLQSVTVGDVDEMDIFDGQFPQFSGNITNSLEVTIASGSITSLVSTWRNRWY